jgi:HK97 gp10 family phage protein
MARVTVTFNKGTFAEIADEMERRVGLAAATLDKAIQAKLKIGGPPRSKPGEHPHSDKGGLRQSYKPTTIRTQNVIRGTVASNLEYAPYLEYGTSKMAPRPLLRPTMAEKQDEIIAILKGKP